MRFFRHSLGQVIAAGGADIVIGGVLLPSECTLNNVWGEVHMVGLTAQEFDKAALYGCSGYVLPVEDPNATNSFDTIWDTMVPKDTDFAAGALDLDAESANVSPEFEPGEPNINRLMDLQVNDQDHRFYHRRKMISFASRPVGYNAAATPDSWIPVDTFRVRSRKNITADFMSAALLGVSSPTMDDVTVTSWASPADSVHWMQIKYLDVTLEQAFMQLAGLVETGAETPWEEAAALLEDLLEPTVVEITAGDFIGFSWNVFAALTFDVTVPGLIAKQQISAA